MVTDHVNIHNVVILDIQMSLVDCQVIKGGGHRVLGGPLEPGVSRGRALVQRLLTKTKVIRE